MKKYQEFENTKRKQFLQRLASIYRTKYSVVEGLVSLEQKSSLRFNTLQHKVSEQQVVDQLKNAGLHLQPITWAAHAYEIHGDKSIASSHEYFVKGYYYIQNASSFIPPIALDPQAGDKILDMCAAPGGKSVLIGQLSDNKADVTVNDKSRQRLHEMQTILQTYGVKVQTYHNEDAKQLNRVLDTKFDKILLDAQCSNEGRIDLNHPRAMRFWSPNKYKELQYLQISMLETAYKLLKPGGVVVYSTCTFAPEENETVVSTILDRHSDLTVQEIPVLVSNRSPVLLKWEREVYNPAIINALRVVPTPYMEGFFVCKIHKNTSS